MEQNTKLDQIPYIVYESAEAKAERTQKRLIIAIVICVIMLALSNIFWLYEWSQYDYSGMETSIEQDGEENTIRGVKINAAKD